MSIGGFRNLPRFAVAIVLLILPSPVIGQSGKGGKPKPLIVTLADTTDDRVLSDGKGSYAGVFDNGYFQLDLESSRRLVVDFRDCEPGSDCSAPFAGTVIAVSGTLYPEMNTKSQIENLEVGSTISTGFRIRFKDPWGDEWTLRYFGDTETCGTSMPTGLANASRTSETEWRIFAPSGTVACLLRIQTSRGRETFTPGGRYRVPFSLSAVR